MAQAKAYIVGTLDTKGEELLYIRDLLAADGVQSCVVDVGTGSAARPPGVDVSAAEVAARHPDGADAVLTLEDRGQAVAAMGEALARFLPTRDDIGGVIGAGGVRQHRARRPGDAVAPPSACRGCWSPPSRRATSPPMSGPTTSP